MCLPTFVIAGQPNEGKTTVIATLTENDNARRGPIPGTTRKAVKYTVELDNEAMLVVYDTPGFENPGELLEWFRSHARQHLNPAKVFLADSEHQRAYPLDCEILKPISEGAAVIHVIDPGREFQDVDAYEAEIFRLCNVPRIGVMNRRSGSEDHSADWVAMMSREMNTWREFNACEAVFADRIELLKAFTIATPKWNQQMEVVIRSLEEQWNVRLYDTASLIIQILREAVKSQVSEVCKSEDQQEAAKKMVADKLRRKIGEFEEGFRRKVRKFFRHGAEHWKPGGALELDLFDKKVWQIFGLSKKAMILACAVTGAGLLVIVDIALGGTTFGLAALAGAVVGGMGAYFGAEKAVDITLPGFKLGFIQFGGKKIGGWTIKAGLERRSKLPSILLDRMTCYAVVAARWSHGRTPADSEPSPIANQWGITHALEQSKDSKAVSRLQSLIELWHRSREKTLGEKVESAIRDAESWLKGELVEHMRNATCERNQGLAMK